MNESHRRAGMLALVTVLAMLGTGCAPSAEELLQEARNNVEMGDYGTAVINLKNLLQEEPENADGRLLLAHVSYAMGDVPSAEKELARAIEAGADSIALMPFHYEIQLALGKNANVLELLAMEGGADGLTDVQELEFRGLALLGLGSSIEAEASFRDALIINSASLRARWGIAASAAAQGRLDDASAAVDQLLLVDPDYARGLLLQGQLQLRQGRLDGAAASFEKAVNASRKIPDRMLEMISLAGLADTLLGQAKLDEASAVVRQLQLFAGGAPATRLLAARVAYAKQDFVAATAQLEPLLAVSPNNTQAMLLMGAVNFAQGNFAQAELGLSRVVALAPDNLAARRLLAAAQVEMQRPGEAMETLSGLTDEVDGDPRLSVLAGQAMMQMGEQDEAIAMLEKGLEQSPDDSQIKLALAGSYLSAQRYDDAIALAQTIPEDEMGYRRSLVLALAYAATDASAEAEQEIQKIVKDNANDAMALKLASDFYLRKGDIEQARAYLEQGLRADENNTDVRMALGYIDLRQDKVADAMRQYETIIRIDSDNVRAMVALAELSAVQGDLDRAISLLLNALEVGGQTLQPRLMLAKAYMRQRNNERAEQVAAEAVRLAPDNAAAQAIAGDAWFNTGKYREALGAWSKAVEIAPQNAEFWFDLARAQLALGERADARQSLQKALDLNPELDKAWSVMALQELRDGNVARALEIAADLQARNPEDVGPVLLEADIFMRERRNAEAAAAYQRALALRSTSRTAIRAYQTANAAGQSDAHQILIERLKVEPDDWSVETVLAQYFAGAGNVAEAERRYERAIELNANNAPAMNNLAWLRYTNGLPDALPMAERAYEAAPQSPTVADTYGWILVESGKVNEGIAILEQASEANPNSGEIQWHLAAAYERAGDKGRSRDILRTLLNSNQNFPGRAEAEQLLRQLESE